MKQEAPSRPRSGAQPAARGRRPGARRGDVPTAQHPRPLRARRPEEDVVDTFFSTDLPEATGRAGSWCRRATASSSPTWWKDTVLIRTGQTVDRTATP